MALAAILGLAALLQTPAPPAPSAPPDTVEVAADDVEVAGSCRVAVAAERVPDANGDGVLHVVGDGITVDLAGAHLHGAAEGAAPDAFTGIGIRITGKDVTLRNARVSGFKVGILAEGADGLVLEGCDVSGNFRQRLRSTPAAEDPADWLWPHENDRHEWRERYGAGIAIESSAGVSVRGCRAREGQNGLILDRVREARVYDNDFSFLSGWGLALWRTSDSVVTRNALDFCVRGYSHGVYNRGQDSAGLLMFEQCSRNLVAENSITHGGDGIFAFAGKEALGEAPPPEEGFSYERRGNNENVFWRNDLSYAPAHGLELTFSFDNRILDNRFVENAICGVWGGYSQGTTIRGNRFERNGQAGYGLERGGVNIEHGQHNLILDNRFEENAAGVHLWWDPDEGLLRTPWAKANGAQCAHNRVHANEFRGDAVAIQVRDCQGTHAAANRFQDVGEELRGEVESDADAPLPIEPGQARLGLAERLLGETRPVGAREHLRGRERIVITAWGPYDWQAPLLQRLADRDGAHVWRLLGDAPLEGFSAEGEVELALERDGALPRLVVRPREPGGAVPYTLRVRAGGVDLAEKALLVDTTWRVIVFPWSVEPREDERRWRHEGAERGLEFHVRDLRLPYAHGSPSQLPFVPDEVRHASLPADRFGTFADATLRMPAGRWRVRTTSDDGVRVWAAGRAVIDAWTWHAPQVDTGEFELPRPMTIRIRVEHFELDGYATLELALERTD